MLPLFQTPTIFFYFRFSLSQAVRPSDFPAGTAGTDRVHPRRAADRRFFFQNRILPVSYPCPVVGTRVRVRVRGYSGSGTGTEFFPSGYGYWFDVNRGGIFEIWISRVGRYEVRGRRVQRIFSKKKRDRPFSNPYQCTHLPTYTRARIKYRGYRVRVHGHGLYPADFSKPLRPQREYFSLSPASHFRRLALICPGLQHMWTSNYMMVLKQWLCICHYFNFVFNRITS
jgi:hypothetical protein